MDGLFVPHFAESQTATITIDGITYRVPLLDGDSRLYTTPRAVGASEVLPALKETVSPSTTRVTVATPASGKKARLVSLQLSNRNATATTFEVYFGTGASIATTAGKEVFRGVLDLTDQPTIAMVWPDGAGPVGAVDDVISLRTSGDITTLGECVILYREE